MPSCHQALSECSHGSQDVVLIGEVAHIAGEHGGEKGGRPSARYDAKMTVRERNSLSNLLFICPNCHKKIDAHPHGERDYPVGLLLSIKRDHESNFAAAEKESMASVSFGELEKATEWIHSKPFPSSDLDFSRISLEDKIQRNGLSVSSQNLITSRLASTLQVRSFIQSLSQNDPKFPDRLISGFLEYYHKLRRTGTSSGEELFDSMCLFARRGFKDFKIQFAAEAVLVYLFETCEVFER